MTAKNSKDSKWGSSFQIDSEYKDGFLRVISECGFKSMNEMISSMGKRPEVAIAALKDIGAEAKREREERSKQLERERNKRRSVVTDAKVASMNDDDLEAAIKRLQAERDARNAGGANDAS